MASKPSAPPPRSYKNEMFDSMRAQAAIMPELMALERLYVPQMQKLQMEGYEGQMLGFNQMFKKYTPEFGQRALEYTQSIAPAMAAGARASSDAYMQSLGPNAGRMMGIMEQQALSDLERGGALGDKERMFAEDAARRAAAARGISLGNQGLALELLTSHQMSQNREDRSRKYASDVFGMRQGVANAGLQAFGSTVNGGINSLSPMNMVGLARQGQTELGPSYIRPESGYNSQLIGANQNLKFQANAAAAAGQNQLVGAGIGAVGAAIGCWVARAAYGEDNPRWVVFRDWMIFDAPEWLRSIYIERGESFAEKIKDSKIAKFIVRKIMDTFVVNPIINKINN